MSERKIKRASVHRAQDLSLEAQTPILAISAHQAFPHHESPVSSLAMFDSEAREIVNALIATLPGGTLDAVLVRLLEHKRSQFVVPIPTRPGSSGADAVVLAMLRESGTDVLELLRCGREWKGEHGVGSLQYEREEGLISAFEEWLRPC
jgi:hypothetical protein